MRRLTTLAALLTTVVGAGCFGGSNTGKSTITGKIVLSGQQVPANTIVTLAGPTSAQATAGTDGAYKFEKLPAGTYAVLAQLDSTSQGRLAAQVKVDDGKSASAPDLTFQPLGEITGTATLGQATGNAGIVVAVPGTDRLAVTDDAGHFTISDVPSGSHDVFASLPGRGTATKTGLAVPYKASVDAGTLTLTGTGAGSISGTVTVNGAADASGVVLVLSGPVSGTMRAAANGTYSFTNLPDGTYVVTATGDNLSPASQTQTINVSGGGGANAHAFTFTVTSAPTNTISGTVHVAGVANVSGVIVSLSGPVTASSPVAADGTYSFASLPDGSYLVTAAGAGLSPASQVLAVTVSGASVTGQDFHFVPSSGNGQLSGTVAITGQTDASGVVLTLSGPVSGRVTTPASGAYTFSNLPDGDYLITATGSGLTPSSEVQSATISAGAQVGNLNFQFAPSTAQGSIAGTVTLTGLSDASGVVLNLTGPVSAGSVTPTSGAYSFAGLPDGTYLLTANATSALPAGAQLSVTVAQGAAVTGQDFTFQPVGSVAGHVRQNGQPVAGASVAVGGTSLVGVTLADGSYTLSNIPVGAVSLTALAQGAQPATLQASVTRGQGTTLDFALQPALGGAQLRSQVTLPGQGGAAGILVTVGQGNSTVTDSDGGYTLAGLNGGTYQIDITSPDGGRTESIPALAVQNSDGFVLDNGVLVPLAPIELQAGQRIVQSPGLERLSDPVNGKVVLRSNLQCNINGGSTNGTVLDVRPRGASQYGVSGNSNCVGQVELVDSAGTVQSLGHGFSPTPGAILSGQTQAVLYVDNGSPGSSWGDLWERTSLGQDVQLATSLDSNSVQLSADGTKATAVSGYLQYCVDLTTATASIFSNYPYYTYNRQIASTGRVFWSGYDYSTSQYFIQVADCSGANAAILFESGDYPITYNYAVSADGSYVLIPTNGSVTVVSTAGGQPVTIGGVQQFRPLRPGYYLTSSNGADMLLFTGTATQISDGDGGTVPSVALDTTVINPPNTSVSGSPYGYIYTTDDGAHVVYGAYNSDDGGTSLYAGDLFIDGGSVGLPYDLNWQGGSLQRLAGSNSAVVISDDYNGLHNNAAVVSFGAGQPALRVIEDDAGIYQLATSANSGRLVYQQAANGQFFSENIDGTGQAALLTSGAYSSFTVAPAGDFVAIDTNANYEDGGSSNTLVAQSTAGGTVVPVADGTNLSNWYYTSNGQALLVFTGNNSDTTQLMITGADGNNAHNLPGLVSTNIGVTEYDNGLLYLGDVDFTLQYGTLYYADYTGNTVEALTGRATYNQNSLGGEARRVRARSAAQVLSGINAVPLAPNVVLSFRDHSSSPYYFQDGAYLIRQ